MFDFSVCQYRCFYKPQVIHVRPITIFLGENSSGKSSLLAATRLFIDLFSNTEGPEFNKEPFNLGAYDQIAHYRGGKFGRAKHFHFEAAIRTRASFKEAGSGLYDIDPTKFSSIDVRVVFKKRHAQPSLSTVLFRCGPVQIEVTFDDPDRFLNIATPLSKLSLTRQQIVRQYHLALGTTADFRFLPFLLGRIFTKRDVPLLEKSGSKEIELEFLSNIVNTFLREFRRFELRVFAPMRTKPERTYDPRTDKPDPEGEHVPYLLARLKSERSKAWANLKRKLDEFGVASGLFESIDVKKKGTSDSDPFQIYFKILNYTANMIDVGYGISQILPLLTELLISEQRRNMIYLMQQPEVHLHPRAQAEFGSLVQKLFPGSGSYCVIETHSDYIVDRIRTHVAAGDLKKEDVSLVFFERGDHEVTVSQLELDDNGNLTSVPNDYRSFFKRETLRTLGVSEDVFNS